MARGQHLQSAFTDRDPDPKDPAESYAKKYGVGEGELKEVIARIAWKNHVNGAKNPKAQFQKEVPMETIMGGDHS